jgi:hypothetical protein
LETGAFLINDDGVAQNGQLQSWTPWSWGWIVDGEGIDGLTHALRRLLDGEDLRRAGMGSSLA